MKYSFPQLEEIWIRNGGRRSAAPMAAAIALAESGGDPAAVNHNTNGSIDYGGWQINTVHGALATASNGNIDASAKAAIAISNNGADWSPWSTFKNGAYRQFLGTAAPAPGTAIVPAASSSPASSGGGGLFTTTHVGELKYAAVWVGAVAAGFYLLWNGLNQATHNRPRKVARETKRAAETAAAAAA